MLKKNIRLAYDTFYGINYSSEEKKKTIEKKLFVKISISVFIIYCEIKTISKERTEK